MSEEYKKTIRNIIQLLINQDYTPQEIYNILKFNGIKILEVEIQQNPKNNSTSNTTKIHNLIRISYSK